MTALTGKVGFASPISEKSLSRKRTAGVELIATLALAFSLIVAATAISFGVARAQSAVPIRTTVTVCGAHSAVPFCAPRLRGTSTLRP
jgi:hypothetical protein